MPDPEEFSRLTAAYERALNLKLHPELAVKEAEVKPEPEPTPAVAEPEKEEPDADEEDNSGNLEIAEEDKMVALIIFISKLNRLNTTNTTLNGCTYPG